MLRPVNLSFGQQGDVVAVFVVTELCSTEQFGLCFGPCHAARSIGGIPVATLATILPYAIALQRVADGCISGTSRLVIRLDARITTGALARGRSQRAPPHA